MSDSKTSSEGGGGDGGNRRRNLPSWMSSKQNEKTAATSPTVDQSKQVDRTPRSSSTNFSKLLEGVVFVLSGFVNPERAALRSQALEMGAEYQPDWTSDSTLLVCAYSNTPKFRQVEADCGTIVKKEWILECYNQKQLVEIDSYLMHAGKPWRKSKISCESGSACYADPKASLPRNSERHIKSGLHPKSTAAASYKGRASDFSKEFLCPSKVKEWVIDDLSRTVSWLESQEEKPEPSEIKRIAAEGILICLQDSIDFLEQNQDIQQITEQWNVVPRAIEEMIKLVDAGNASVSITKKDLCRQAKICKEIYETELSSLDGSKTEKLKLKTVESGKIGDERDDAAYDSDETIEMTQEEIETAYHTVVSKSLTDK